MNNLLMVVMKLKVNLHLITKLYFHLNSIKMVKKCYEKFGLHSFQALNMKSFKMEHLSKF
jgi:hypothetical protein